MATPLALVWDLIAHDSASPAFARVAATADKAAASTGRASAATAGFGKKMLGAFAGIAAIDIGAHMVKDAVQFQKSMTLIQTQAGASADKVKDLSAAVLKMAGSVGTGPEKLADSLYHIVSAGQGILTTSQELQALRVAAEGAKVGNSDLTETTNALTAAITSGISGVQNMQQAMGALNAIVGGGDMKLSDLNEALGSGILVVAKQFGLSLTDVGAALDVFGDNNIRGADAASMLRQAIMAMAKPVATGAKELDHLGLSSTQLAQDMQSGGLNKALVDLKAHLPSGDVASLTKQLDLMNGKVDVSAVATTSLGEILTTVFGKKAGPGIAILVDQLTRFQIKQDEIKKGATGFGLAWKATQGTASFALSSISAEASAASIAVGNKLLPTVTAVARWLGTELPGAAHIAAAAFAPFGQAFGAIGSAAKSAFGGISNVVKPIAPELRDITEVALAMWAGFKAGTLAAAGIRAFSDLLAGMRLKVVNAALSVQSLGASFKTSAVSAVAAGSVIEGEAATTSAAVVASGDAARIGWAGLAGPIGAAAVGIITLVSVFHKSSSASKEAAAAAKAYSDALSSGGGKSDLLGTITSQLASNNVPQKIADLNKALGSAQFTAVSFATAIQQGGAPLAALKTHLQAVIAAGTSTSVSMSKAGGTVNAVISPAALKATKLLSDLNAQFGALSKETQKDLVDTKAFAGVSASIDNVSQSTQVAAGTATTYAQMLGIAVDKNGVAAVSSDTLSKAVQTVSSAYASSTQTGNDFLAALNGFSSSAGTAADRATLIGATLKAANGDALNFAAQMSSAGAANRTFVSDIQQAAKAVGKNGESTKAYLTSIVNLKKGTIDYTKAGAGPLISDLQGIQTAGMNAAQAMYQHALGTESAKKAADDAYKVYVGQTRGQLIEEFTKLTGNAGAAKKLADNYLGVPAKVKTLIEQEGADPVVTVLNKIGTQLSYLTGRSWTAKVAVDQTVTTTYKTARGPGSTTYQEQVPQYKALGGIIHGRGTGTSDTAGLFALSNGEAVIPAKAVSAHTGIVKALIRAGRGMASGGIYVAGTSYATERTAHNAALAAAKAQINLGLKIDSKDLTAFNKAIKGTVDQAAAAFNTLFADTQKAGVSSGLLKALKSEDAALNKEINVRNGIAAKLATVKASMASLSSSTAQAVTGFFDVSGAGAGPTGVVSGAALQFQQGQALTQIKQFAAGLKTLEGKHLNSAYLQSLAAAGPGALPQVRALLSLPSLGGINATAKSIQSYANATGAGVANSVYGAQASSLAAQQKAADARATLLAKRMDASFEKAVNRALSRPIIATYKGRTLFEITREEALKAARR